MVPTLLYKWLSSSCVLGKITGCHMLADIDQLHELHISILFLFSWLLPSVNDSCTFGYVEAGGRMLWRRSDVTWFSTPPSPQVTAAISPPLSWPCCHTVTSSPSPPCAPSIHPRTKPARYSAHTRCMIITRRSPPLSLPPPPPELHTPRRCTISSPHQAQTVNKPEWIHLRPPREVR